MAYDVAFIDEHNFDLYDFGANADEVISFRGPPGYQGTVLNIGVSVTEAFACTTTPAQVLVGTAADPDAYGRLNIADLAADVDFFDVSDDTDAISAAAVALIPADQLIQVTLVQSTDNTADTGQGHPRITIFWQKI